MATDTTNIWSDGSSARRAPAIPCTWTRTHRPEFAIRSLWRPALTKYFLRSTDSQVLVHPLGQCTANVSSTWLWKYSPAEQRLCVPYNRLWSFYHVVSGRRQSVNRLYHLRGSSNALPPDSRAATVSIHGPLARLISFGLSALPPQDDQALSFSQILDSLPAPSIWAVQEYALPSDLGPIVRSLLLGTSRAIRDGPYKDKFGTFAFTILDNQDNSILNLNVVPGHPDDQGAYRSELAGLFGIVQVINRLCSWAGIESGGIEVGCNRLSALEKALNTWSVLQGCY
jgi:hypothetical protein